MNQDCWKKYQEPQILLDEITFMEKSEDVKHISLHENERGE